MAETLGATSSKAEKEPGKLRKFGQGVIDLLTILGEAHMEELIHGHAVTDRFPKSSKKLPLDLEKINSIH